MPIKIRYIRQQRQKFDRLAPFWVWYNKKVVYECKTFSVSVGPRAIAGIKIWHGARVKDDPDSVFTKLELPKESE